MRVERLTPTDKLIHTIADNMRQGDIDEVRLLSPDSLFDIIKESVNLSNGFCHVITFNGVVIGVYGARILEDHVMPWFLGTTNIVKYRKRFHKESKSVMNEFEKVSNGKVLFNIVHTENKVSIKWLSKLGFTIGQSIKVNEKGDEFYRFYKEEI